MPIVLFQGLAEVVEPPPPATFPYGRAGTDVLQAVSRFGDVTAAIGHGAAVGDSRGDGDSDEPTGRTGGSGAGPYGRRGRIN